MIARANDLEAESLHGVQNSIIRRIDGELGHGGSGGNSRLGDKSLQNWVIFGGCKCRRAESLDVEGDGGTNV